MTVIILEGSDCCYKTTVANKLSEKLGWEVVKGSSFELAECNNEQLYDHFVNLSKIDNVVIDRSIYSNYVYATLYKDYTILSDEQRSEIERLIKDKAILVYLYASEDEIKHRLNSRGDDYVKDNMIGDILRTYDSIIPKSPLEKLTYDTGTYGSDLIVNSILANKMLIEGCRDN